MTARGPWLAYLSSEWKCLIRMKSPLIFLFVMPTFLTIILGPATSLAFGEDARARGVIGYAVLFSFAGVSYAGNALYREHWNGTWPRQAIYRPPVGQFLLGKLTPMWVLGTVQLTFFVVLALIFLDMPVRGGAGPAALSMVAVMLAVATAVLIGGFLYVVTRTGAAFQGYSYLVLLGGGALGGCVAPFEALPAGSQLIGRLTPQYWTLRAMEAGFFARGEPIDVVISCAVLALMAVVLAAAVRYRYDPLAEHTVAW